MIVFQSSRKGIFVDDCSRYLASRLFGKFKGKSVKFDLMMVLTVVIMFLVVMIVLYP